MEKLPVQRAEELADDIEASVAWHDGDALATIATHLKDWRHLREQLSLAQGSISAGFFRGWSPSYERKPEMLDKPQARTPFRKSFDEWWKAQTPELQARTDVRAAWTIFQAGYTAGGRKELKRFIYRAGRFKITVWAETSTQARKQAMIEADFRAAARGGKTPAGGWQLEKLT